MGITTLYYFLGFMVFIVCRGGLQKWVKLPLQKKYRVGIITLCLFLFSLIGFVFLVLFEFLQFNGAYVISLGMLFFFLFFLFTAFFMMWYNDKYDKQINTGTALVVLCLAAFGIIFLFLKDFNTSEKEELVKNIMLKTVVINITFDQHKPYSKDMILADGQYLPMPETMNNTLQIGDSIFKEIGESIFTVVNSKTKIKNYYRAAIHTRVFGKPQQK